ncbi:hypothetical protein F503_02056 [Ophiostoma piceae UAMH 11346]|uniref:Uncharacterized protein n=1 Tax=Ophiostoma piceae (strain UAMH 11346) TaxID=1262450 RepID=S3CAQ4_OPHP1|nr:hypothetical protein F503_02056 [Ophiostoma piceae UAMH 11346]
MRPEYLMAERMEGPDGLPPPLYAQPMLHWLVNIISFGALGDDYSIEKSFKTGPRTGRWVILGSRQFCVGSAHTVTCRDLPMNLSDILPGTVEASLQDTFSAVRDVDTALHQLTTPYVQGCFVAALVLMLVETVLFIVSAYG